MSGVVDDISGHAAHLNASIVVAGKRQCGVGVRHSDALGSAKSHPAGFWASVYEQHHGVVDWDGPYLIGTVEKC